LYRGENESKENARALGARRIKNAQKPLKSFFPNRFHETNDFFHAAELFPAGTV